MRNIYYKQTPINLRKFGVNSDAYNAVIQNYISKIKSNMIHFLQKNKNLDEDKAFDFVEDMFNMGYERTHKIINEIKDYYQQKVSTVDAAKKLMDKYYKIAVLNSENPIYSQAEVVEVTESIDTTDKKLVSKKLFWLFIIKLNDINIKFNLNTHYIKGIDNSLNNNYFLNMESNKINVQDVIYEFKYSKIFSSFLKFIEDKNEISFFLNINDNNMLQFGYMVNTKKYELGYYNYTNIDIGKLDFIIEKTNSDISFRELSRGFKTNLAITYQIKKTLIAYLNKYDDIDFYINILKNEFTIIIESNNSDVLNKKYLEQIISNHLSKLEYKRVSIINKKIDNGDVYYISII